MKLPTGRRLVVVYLLLAAIISLGMPLTRKVPGERAVYRKAAVRYVDGEQFYRTDDGPAFTYPPFFVLAYVPFAWLPERAAASAWYFMNFCLVGAIVSLTLRLARPNAVRAKEEGRRGPPVWVPYVVLGVLSARLLVSPIEWQGHDLIVYLAAALAIGAWAHGGNKAAGVWAGLAAACKATPLLLLPCFARQRRLVASALMLVVLAAATLLPDLIRSNPDASTWAGTWYGTFVSKVSVGSAPAARGAWWKWNPLNQSLSGTVYRLATPVKSEDNVCLYELSEKQIKYLTIALQLGVLGLIFWATSPRRLRGMDRQQQAFTILGMGGMVLCGMLLLSPMSSKQHFCVLFTPLVFCVFDFFYRRRDPLVGAALAMCLVFGAMGKDLIGRSLYKLTLAGGALTFCTVVCLLTCSYIILQRAREAARAETDRADEMATPDAVAGSIRPPLRDAA